MHCLNESAWMVGWLVLIPKVILQCLHSVRKKKSIIDLTLWWFKIFSLSANVKCKTLCKFPSQWEAKWGDVEEMDYHHWKNCLNRMETQKTICWKFLWQFFLSLFHYCWNFPSFSISWWLQFVCGYQCRRKIGLFLTIRENSVKFLYFYEVAAFFLQPQKEDFF